jgi:hypothetical protein
VNYLDYLLQRTHGALFLSFEDLADILGSPVQTLYNQRSEKTFPFRVFSVGRKIKVSIFDLAYYLQTGEIPVPEVSQTDNTLEPAVEIKRRPGRPPKYKGRSL